MGLFGGKGSAFADSDVWKALEDFRYAATAIAEAATAAAHVYIEHVGVMREQAEAKDVVPGELSAESYVAAEAKATQDSETTTSLTAEGDTLVVRINGEVVARVNNTPGHDPVLEAIRDLAGKVAELSARTKPGTVTLTGVDGAPMCEAARVALA